MAEFKELVGFLDNPSPQVRAEVLKMIQGFCFQPEHRSLFLDPAVPVVQKLCRLTGDREEVAKEALSALVNLAQDVRLREVMIDKGLVDLVIRVVRDDGLRSLHHFAAMLLSNLTLDDKGAELCMQRGSPLEGLSFRRLLNRLLEGKEGPAGGTVKPTQFSKDPLEYLAYALNNLAKFSEARQIVCDPKLQLLPQLVPLLSTRASEIRKLGALSVIRNCCMDRELQAELLRPEHGLLAAILGLLTGVPSEIDAEDMQKLLPELQAKIRAGGRREQSEEARKLVLEMIHLCLLHKPSRLYLKSCGVYFVLREDHKMEQKLKCQELDDLIEQLVQYLLMPEEDEEVPAAGLPLPPSQPDPEQIQSLAYKGFRQPSPAAAAEDPDRDQPETELDFDDAESLLDALALNDQEAHENVAAAQATEAAEQRALAEAEAEIERLKQVEAERKLAEAVAEDDDDLPPLLDNDID